jgi:hypothetical protein
MVPRPRGGGLAPFDRGKRELMFVWYKRSGQRSRTRFIWWPLILSLVLSVLLTLALNAR